MTRYASDGDWYASDGDWYASDAPPEKSDVFIFNTKVLRG